MPVPRIVDFRQTVPEEESVPAPDRLVSGSPRTVVSNHFTDPGERFYAGTWSSSVGKWRVSYTEHEFCHLLEGRVVMQSDDGEVSQFGPGDAWVIPAGFSGTWETVEPARKRYAIFEPGEG